MEVKRTSWPRGEQPPALAQWERQKVIKESGFNAGRVWSWSVSIKMFGHDQTQLDPSHHKLAWGDLRSNSKSTSYIALRIPTTLPTGTLAISSLGLCYSFRSSSSFPKEIAQHPRRGIIPKSRAHARKERHRTQHG